MRRSRSRAGRPGTAAGAVRTAPADAVAALVTLSSLAPPPRGIGTYACVFGPRTHVWVPVPEGQVQRVRRLRAASAAAPAVEVRSTSGPIRTGCAPAARKASTSPSVSPPSGPTTTATVPDDGTSTAAIDRRGRARGPG